MRYGVRFHVNMERSRFPRRNRVDYKALNVLSTVDLEVHLKGRRKFKSGSKVYFVERLISRRRLKNEVFDDSDWNELTVIQVLFFIIGAIWRL